MVVTILKTPAWFDNSMTSRITSHSLFLVEKKYVIECPDMLFDELGFTMSFYFHLYFVVIFEDFITKDFFPL